MSDSCTAEDHAAGDVDEVSGGDEIAEGIKERGHRFAGEDVSGEKYAREDGQKSQLHGLRVGVGLAGDEDAERERDEQIGKRKNREKDDTAMYGHLEDETHERQNEAELEETDAEIRKKLAQEQAHRTNRRDEKLLQGASLFFADDGEGGEERSDVE